jgi:transcriptional regulator with XRE-family HTH domain
MKAMKYWKEKQDRPDLTRFALDYRFVPSYLHKWITGRARPSYEHIQALSAALGVNVGWLLFGEESAARTVHGGLTIGDDPLPAQPTHDHAEYQPRKRRRAGRTAAKAIGTVVLLASLTAPAAAQPLPVGGDDPARGIMSTRRRRRPPLARAA